MVYTTPLTTESPTTHYRPTPSQQTRLSNSRADAAQFYTIHANVSLRGPRSASRPALRLTARAPSVPVRAYARSARRPAPAWYW